MATKEKVYQVVCICNEGIILLLSGALITKEMMGEGEFKRQKKNIRRKMLKKEGLSLSEEKDNLENSV